MLFLWQLWLISTWHFTCYGKYVTIASCTYKEKASPRLSYQKYPFIAKNNLIFISRYTKVTGDVLLSSGVVAYLGPFTVDFRNVSPWFFCSFICLCRYPKKVVEDFILALFSGLLTRARYYSTNQISLFRACIFSVQKTVDKKPERLRVRYQIKLRYIRTSFNIL